MLLKRNGEKLQEAKGRNRREEPGRMYVTLSSSSGSAAAIKISPNGDFPGGPAVKTPHSQCRGQGSIPGHGN